MSGELLCYNSLTTTGKKFSMQTNKFYLRTTIVLATVLINVIAGCNGSPATSRVTGTITFDGKPLPNASLVVAP
jgi:hypothetical protein